ncbi:siroheme decarboxylase subunit beta [Halorubrum lacusprofundi]|jgi:DNA-binding Lrp family transcriptional regulator|uniref:siroheme decarboxylase n=1 Tax=Halorubrum lacusprofundi (strain ATCC 49239 / DSM 5036 / JCM 8891 / ACAM 34) TaxID=416348 RepID=B9LQU0_HALLT|nr:Lrp/AsnC family transcriptional regulator [Halorubrum lacusprofundi]ACM55692.1 putative transcriptional regulator, AsnC family [Halorubrum lacusprofundi ATCC 49239]MCG1007161.1 Lrp/AsnC family transcriptional regulator [Halorubrum lacusprofundi]
MSLDADWRADIDAVDAALIDEYQSGFPVESRPFERVARDITAETGVDIDADAVLDRVRDLRERGVFRRFGAVLNPPVIGSSTLAAVRAPEDRFNEVAEVINGYQQVNHNYRRDHEWNQWFVVTAGSRETRDAILAEIEERTGCEVLALPMLTDYYIDLEFPVVNGDRFARESGEARSASDSASGERSDPRASDHTDVSATRISENARGDLTPLEGDLLLAIQDGFPLSSTPYADVASEIDAPIEDVLAAVEQLLADGCIKRIGCVVNHVVTGFTNNCMVVWDVPDDELDERGEAVGSLPYVTLCYHRPRRPEQEWEYNLFTMIHGREAEAVDAKIDELAADHLPFTHERLYSTETLKQTGARYEDLVADGE